MVAVVAIPPMPEIAQAVVAAVSDFLDRAVTVREGLVAHLTLQEEAVARAELAELADKVFHLLSAELPITRLEAATAAVLAVVKGAPALPLQPRQAVVAQFA